MIEFNYVFTIDSGPEYYSEQTDETFCDTEDVSYNYSISQNEILTGLIEYLELKDKPLINQAKEIIKALEVEIDESEIVNALNNYEDIYNIIDNLLGNIEDFIDEEMEDFLKDYYEQDAYNEFLNQ